MSENKFTPPEVADNIKLPPPEDGMGYRSVNDYKMRQEAKAEAARRFKAEQANRAQALINSKNKILAMFPPEQSISENPGITDGVEDAA